MTSRVLILHLVKSIILAIILLFPNFSQAQKEASIWIFDNQDGLDFKYDPPREIHTSLESPQSLKSVMSDKDGKMLFFTDSWQVYNAADQLMENGKILEDTFGISGNVQNIMTIPVPNTNSQYYIFASHYSQWYPEFNQNDVDWTLHYSIVDLNYNDGLGKVISKKNVLCDSVDVFTIIGDRYNRFGWLIVFQSSRKKLKVFSITNLGIKYIEEYETDHSWARHIRSTPDGKKLLLSTNYQHQTGIRIFDFNLDSGEITQGNFIRMNSNDVGSWINDFECSSDSRFLYVIHDNDELNPIFNRYLQNIYRYDLSKSSSIEIEESQELIYKIPDDYGDSPNNMQLNWKGEIVLIYPDSHFSLIKNPKSEFPLFIFDAFKMSQENSFYFCHYPSYLFDDCYRSEFPELAGSDSTICVGSELIIGSEPVDIFDYVWSPSEFLDDPYDPNPSVFFNYNAFQNIDTIKFTVTATDTLGCVFTDSVNVVAKPAFNNEIIGPKSLCPGQDSIAYWLPHKDPEASYSWMVEGGDLLEGSSPDSVLVNWGETNYDAMIDVEIMNRFQCLDKSGPLGVKIYKVIDTEIPNGPDTLNCLEDIFLYQILPKHGSFFDWNVINGDIIDGYGTNKVWIDWMDEEKYGKVWIDESIDTDLEICFGRSDTLSIVNPKAFGSENIDFYRVSSILEDTSILQVDYSVANPEFFKDNFHLLRTYERDWNPIASLDKWNSNFDLYESIKNQRICNYQITGNNICDSLVISGIHQNILLKVVPETDSLRIELNWNNDTGWSGQNVYYDIYRKLDEEYGFSKIASTSDTSYVFDNLKDGFNHNFFVMAINQDNRLSSLSNIDGFEYKHPVFIPNVITPNNDGYNDYFKISNIELYSDNELIIYSRYGKEILRINNYNNTWNGGDLPSGTYFYQFTTERYKQAFKGWVSILR